MPDDIQYFFAKWIDRLPMPISAADRQGGYNHQLSIWQLEISKTQVFSEPVRGREFFESVIRENIDLGRPHRVQLLFDRKILKTTPGRFSTRVITSGVQPSIHGRMHDSGCSMLDVGAGSSSIQRQVTSIPKVRAPALKLGDPRVMALLAALTLFLHSANGFRNKDLRGVVADLMGLAPEQYNAREAGASNRGFATLDAGCLMLDGSNPQLLLALHNPNPVIILPLQGQR